MRLAVIGLGNIGAGVAKNLVSVGHEVAVYDVDESRIEAATDQGAVAAATLASAIAGADVIFTSLPGPKQIADVAQDICQAAAPGLTWVELSTNDLQTASLVDEMAVGAGISMIDAPVSGGPEGAQAGTLSIYVGGEDHVVERVMSLLQVIGSSVDHLGGRGAGITAKIAQVILCYTQTVTLTEAMILGAKGGVAPNKMLELIQYSAGRSYCADVYGPEIVQGSYDRSFPLGHAAKDLRLAMELAEDLGADLPFTGQVAHLYAEAEVHFGPSSPHCLAARVLESRNGLSLHDMASPDETERI